MIFAATEDELRGAFLGGKRPLPAVVRTVTNPFTREPQLQPTWAPDPEDTRVVMALPGISLSERLASLPHIDDDEDFDTLCDLPVVIATILGEEPDVWAQRLGNPPALVNPMGEPYESHVWELPARVVDALLERDSGEPDGRVRAMTELAARARQSGRRLYCWF
jgi:hypothetical protein